MMSLSNPLSNPNIFHKDYNWSPNFFGFPTFSTNPADIGLSCKLVPSFHAILASSDAHSTVISCYLLLLRI